MPHFPKPFFKKSRGTWYVQLGPKQHNLGPNRDEAFRLYHELMAEQSEPPKPLARDSLVLVFDKFLQWCQEHRAGRTYEWYQWRLQLFTKTIEPSLTVQELRHFHIDEFLGQHPDWTSGMKHGAARAVQRAVRWAMKKGYTNVNPVADYEKPSPGRRKVVLSPEGYAQVLALAPAAEFRDLLETVWAVGCRPQEILAVEARHVDLPNSRWVFPPEEAKGEEWPRIVYLTDRALEISKRLMQLHPTGKLFRNAAGNPWKPYAVNCAFGRVQVRMGLEAMREQGIPLVIDKKLSDREKRKQLEKQARCHAPKYCLYTLRHSWATHALARGVDALTVAVLLGHRDPSQLSKTYQHLSQNPDYLRQQAKKANPESNA